MELTPELIQELEQLIAKGKTDAVIRQLLPLADQTAYKQEILGLSNRWKVFSRDQLSNTLSAEATSLTNNKLNKQLILLLEALKRELAGDKVVNNLFQTENQATKSTFPLPQLLLAMGLAALLSGGLAYFFTSSAAPMVCPQAVNLNGNWTIFKTDSTRQEVGTVKLVQENCADDFDISGKVKSSLQQGEEVDFSSKIGGINKGEIFFIYENFDGEMGICRGVVPSANPDEFTIHCIDMIGFDKDGKARTTFLLQRVAAE